RGRDLLARTPAAPRHHRDQRSDRRPGRERTRRPDQHLRALLERDLRGRDEPDERSLADRRVAGDEDALRSALLDGEVAPNHRRPAATLVDPEIATDQYRTAPSLLDPHVALRRDGTGSGLRDRDVAPVHHADERAFDRHVARRLDRLQDPLLGVHLVRLIHPRHLLVPWLVNWFHRRYPARMALNARTFLLMGAGECEAWCEE